MSPRIFRSLAIGISILIALAVGTPRIAFAGNPLVPGDPLAGGPFVMTFDENGHAALNGQLVPFQAVAGGGIDYFLPVPVVVGSVNVNAPSDVSPNNPNGFSDLLTFSNSPASGLGVLLYQSVLDGPSDGLADVADLSAADTGFSVVETGPEGNNSFLWVTTNGTQYNGISDVPEPSTLIMGGLGLVGLLVIARRRLARTR